MHNLLLPDSHRLAPLRGASYYPRGLETVLEELVALEKELHDPSVRKNRDRLDELLHDSFMEIGRSGEIYDKSLILSTLDTEPTHKVWSQGYVLQTVTDGVILLTYRSAHIGFDNALSRFSRRTSLWTKLESGWKLMYHQGTPTGAFEAC